jgi:hypothetical protein
MTYRIQRHNNRFYAIVLMGERVIYKSPLLATYEAADMFGCKYILGHTGGTL